MKLKNYVLIMLLRFLTSRLCICGLNVTLIVLCSRIITTVLPLLNDYVKNEEILQNIVQNSEEIFIIFGVILEERDFLMEKIGLYPAFYNRKEELTDEACHAYGLALLIVASLLVIPINLIVIPNQVVNTDNIELGLYYFSLISLCIAIFILIKFSYRLLAIQLNWVSMAEEENEE